MIAQEKETTGYCCMEITGKWAEDCAKCRAAELK